MQTIMRAFSGLLLLGLLGCTPALNWRIVHHPDGLWSATFPDKPVQVTRSVNMPTESGETLTAVSMTLWSVRIQEQTFTIGVSESARYTPSQLRSALMFSRLKNIGADLASTLSGAKLLPTNAVLSATGEMQLKPSEPAVKARLMMRTEVQGNRVVEALVAGPAQGFDDEAAETFLQSARLVLQ
ncbi:MAG: hypothetical protein RJA77_729 [Pseudomonadota bacterium]|jgi:hypothetical protein